MEEVTIDVFIEDKNDIFPDSEWVTSFEGNMENIGAVQLIDVNGSVIRFIKEK